MKSRIKQIRKDHGLNQTEFGKRIGVKQGTITGYETGTRIPTDAVILSICREFNVNKEWLRNGTGEMSRPLPEKDEAEGLVSNLLGDGDNELYTLIKEIMRTYSQLDESSKTVLKEFSKNLLENLK